MSKEAKMTHCDAGSYSIRTKRSVSTVKRAFPATTMDAFEAIGSYVSNS
jgi:hypothetical protein|tara:strand:- start:270 stop:416 length:147 start_codon:yes stop_codon:yes gene_type:complete